MSITDIRPVAIDAAGADAPHLPWCTEHWEETEPTEPGVCSAEDLVIRAGSSKFEVMASQVPGGTPSLTLYLPGRDIATAPSFNGLAEAETAAHALLAMVARLRGDGQLAAVHLSAGTTAATGAGQ